MLTERKLHHKVSKLHPAVAAVWAAAIAAGHLLPTFPIYGTGGTFSVSSILNPLSGIIFGPFGGAFCSAIGGFIGNLIAPHTAWMGLGTFVIGTTTAFTTGCVATKKWPLAIIVYIIGTILWFTQETGRQAYFYPIVFYGLGLIALAVRVIFIRKKRTFKMETWKFPAIWLSSFSGLIGGAVLGNFFSLVLFKQPKEIWVFLTVASPIERALFAAGAVLVGVPLLLGIRKIGIRTGAGLGGD